MKKGSGINELGRTLSDIAKRHVKVQTAFVTVKSVDWDKKMMVATGVLDELDYNDVLLGLGNVYRKPAIDSVCLIGMIENQEAAAFLIEAEKVDETVMSVGGNCEVSMKNGEMQLKVGEAVHALTGTHDIKTSNESMRKIMDDLLDAIMQATYTNGGGTTNVTNNLSVFQQIKKRIPNLLS